MHYNVADNSYQQKSRVSYIFVPKKLFGQLLDISPENSIFLKTLDSEFYFNSLEIDDKINITLVIN